MSDLSPLIVATVLLTLPALAPAEAPETFAPYGAPGYGYGYGYPPAYPFPPPGMMPPAAAPWDQGPWGGRPRGQGRYPGWLEPDQGSPMAPNIGTPDTETPGPEVPERSFPPRAAPNAMPGQLRITRAVTEDAYLVRIAVGDGKTGEVQVSPMGRALAISRTAGTETVQEDTFGDGRGYQRSFSYSRGSMSRRIGLPPDADLARMTREEADGTIVLRIPRVPLGRTLPPSAGDAEPQAAPAQSSTGQ